MSYKISYGAMPKKTVSRYRAWLPATAIFLVALTVLARLLFPDETKQLMETLFPLTSESAQDALEVFSQNIRAGLSLGDAVTAFCMEIIDDANIS